MYFVSFLCTQHLRTSNASNEERIKLRLFELQKKENKELEIVKASLNEKMQRLSKMPQQMAKLSQDQAKRVR